MPSIPGVPTPTSLPFSICVPAQNVHCVSAEQLVIGDTKECEGGETPPLASASVTYAKKSYTWHGLEVQTKISYWVGVEEGLTAVWVGESTSEQCARFPIDPPSPTATVADLKDSMDHLYDDIARALDDMGGPSRHSTGGEVLYGLIFIVVVIILAVAPPYPAP